MIFQNILNEGQLEGIRNASEEILERAGIKVMDDNALSLCRKAGAKVNDATGLVRMPRELLRELVGLAPSRYSVRGLGGAEWTIGDGQQWGVAITSDPWIVDYRTRRPRRPCSEDIRRNTIIGQSLEHVMGLTCMDFPVSDAAGPLSYLTALEQHLTHHSKHNYVYATSVESMERWLRIGKILNRGGDLHGSRLFTVAVASLSPLAITGMNIGLLATACEYGFPVVPTVCPTAGMTSPYSISGTLAQGNAEILFILALTQIYRAGDPFLYGFGPAVGNLRNGACLYYTLDKVFWKVAHVALAKSYGLPVMAECGGSMTCHFDPQTGAEGMLFMLAAVASGAHVLPGYGSTLNAIGHSTEMMLLQDEYFRASRFLVRGFASDAKHLSVAGVEQVGPCGEFMTHDLTLEYMRGGEFFAPILFDYSGDAEPGPSVMQRAHRRVEEIVSRFVSPVPGDVREELHRFFRDERMHA